MPLDGGARVAGSRNRKLMACVSLGSQDLRPALGVLRRADDAQRHISARSPSSVWAQAAAGRYSVQEAGQAAGCRARSTEVSVESIMPSSRRLRAGS